MNETIQSAIPDLWPEGVAVTSVVSPLAILRHQAGLLRERTSNLLEAEVKSSQSRNNTIQHDFVIVAPALERATYSLFQVSHDRSQVYPAQIHSLVFASSDEEEWATTSEVLANTQDQFVSYIRSIFSDQSTTTLIHSLIARINDARIAS